MGLIGIQRSKHDLPPERPPSAGVHPYVKQYQTGNVGSAGGERHTGAGYEHPGGRTRPILVRARGDRGRGHRAPRPAATERPPRMFPLPRGTAPNSLAPASAVAILQPPSQSPPHPAAVFVEARIPSRIQKVATPMASFALTPRVAGTDPGGLLNHDIPVARVRARSQSAHWHLESQPREIYIFAGAAAQECNTYLHAEW